MKDLNEKLADPLSTILSQNADLMEANLAIAQLTAENERLNRVVEHGSWSKSFPSEPGLYLLNRWGTFTAMRVLEGGLVHPANHKGRMAEMFSRRTISGSWFGPIEEDK